MGVIGNVPASSAQSRCPRMGDFGCFWLKLGVVGRVSGTEVMLVCAAGLEMVSDDEGGVSLDVGGVVG